MTHTPGPWHFNGRRITTGAFIVADIWNADAPTGQANARLITATPDLVAFVREVALYSNDSMLAVKATNLYIAIVGKEPMLACQHSWGIPARANNRFGQRSTSLYETRCSTCGHTEVRNGLARLRREVINA